MSEQMRVALGQFNELTHEKLAFAQQMGVSGIQMNTPLLPDSKGYWEVDDLLWLKKRCDDYGLRLEALENVPLHFYQNAILGLPGRDEQIANYQKTIRHMGQAGIPILGYHWMADGVWRTGYNAEGRGGARVTSFDMAQVAHGTLIYGIRQVAAAKGRVFSTDEIWDNYLHFIRAVLPVAEEAGVKLALHPDDPPVPELGGIARLFHNADGFKRAMEAAPSPNHGLDFCMGCFSEMGPGVIEAIRHFGSRGQIFYVHFRDVQGCMPAFKECFIGEGNVDVVEAMQALKQVGFTGFFLDDHVPQVIDDSTWNHRGRAHAIGYISALIRAVDRLG